MVKPSGNTDDTNSSGNSAPPKGNVPNTSNQVGKNNAPADKTKGPNAADRARNMKPKDTSSPSSSNNVKPNSGDSKNVPGVGGALKAKQGLDAIKNAKDDPMGAVEKGGTEAAKLGAKAVGNAVAPGVGEAVAKAIDVTDKLLEKTERFFL